MKNIFSKIMLFAVAATALVSCVKDTENTPIDNKEKLIELTLKADKPATVRTELIEGVPYWSADDVIGVYTYTNETYKNHEFTNDSEEATLTTTFTGTTAVTDTLYPYYPYTKNGIAANGAAKVDIPVNQEPTATSFDGAADIMIAKPITLDAEGTQLANLEFARVGAIVKIVLKDNTSSLAAQHISSLTMTAESNLVGRVYLDVINQQLGELYHGQSMSVTATYTEDTQFVVNGKNAVYVIVYPQTLAAGTTLTFEASTEGYAIDKTITLPNDIALEMGKVTTLNVSLTAEHITAEESGLALPFEDDFSWVTANNESTDISTALNDELYSAGSKVYPVGGAIKLGASSAAGSITTVPLDLSQAFTVVLDAKNYGSDTTKVKITVGETSETITLTADYALYAVEFNAASAKESITIASNTASKQRFYLNDLKVVAGHDYKLPPVLSVTPETLAFKAEGGSHTVTCTIENEVAGVGVTATEDVDWLTTSVNGTTVTISATENTSDARNAEVTIAYEGAESKTVTVTQEAVGGGGVTMVAIFAPRKVTATNKTFTDDQGNNWTFTSDAAGFTSSTSYVHAGSNSKTVSHITFESTIEDVTSVTVYAAAKANTNVTIKVYIGSTLIGTSNVLGATQNDGGTAFTVENTQKATGALKIEVSRPSSATGAIYFNQAVVTYTN